MFTNLGDNISTPVVQAGGKFYQTAEVLKDRAVYREVRDVGEFSPAWKLVEKVDPDNMTKQAFSRVGSNKPPDGVSYLPTDSRNAPKNSTSKSRRRSKEHPRNRINRNR